MPYLKSLNIPLEKKNPFPYNVPAIKFADQVDLTNEITFFIGDNGTGKSTLIETLAFRLQLPHMDGSDYAKKSFEAAVKLAPYLQLEYNIDRPIGFFFRAEDFGDYLNSVNRRDQSLHAQLSELDGEVPKEIIQQMKDNANTQLYHMRKDYGQSLNTFSHGEAYMKIIQEKVKSRGIFILDEPEAALSPAKQLSLIFHIKEHLKNNMSQFIIATHSPILMAMPEATIYEITEEGMKKTALEATDHYTITKNFLNNPEAFLRHL